MSTNQTTASSPEMLCLLEEMRDNPGAVSAYAAAGAAAWARCVRRPRASGVERAKMADDSSQTTTPERSR